MSRTGVACLALLWWAPCLQGAPPGTYTPRIAVDQFGYMPGQKKVAVTHWQSASPPSATTNQVFYGADLLADEDGDNVVNAFEFAFDLSPELKDAEDLPEITRQPHDVGGQTGQYWTIKFPRHLGEAGLTYVFEGTTNWVDWVVFCTASGAEAPEGPGFISETGTGYLRKIRARSVLAPARFEGARFRLVWE